MNLRRITVEAAGGADLTQSRTKAYHEEHEMHENTKKTTV